jgi:hypothetical protein
MAAGGGNPRWGVDIGWVIGLLLLRTLSVCLEGES